MIECGVCYEECISLEEYNYIECQECHHKICLECCSNITKKFVCPFCRNPYTNEEANNVHTEYHDGYSIRTFTASLGSSISLILPFD